MKALIEPILGEPQSLKVTETTDDIGTLLTVKVARADMGHIIGKQGELANAIRSIVRTLGSRNGSKVAVRFLEPEASSFTSKLQIISTL